jgi:predicted DNA-binding protein with PD1-like motif
MQARMIHEAHGQRTFAVVLERGDEIRDCLGRFADEQRLSAAQVTAIGAFERATVRFFDWETKEYLPIRVDEQVEVVALNGDIALDPEGKPKLHLHAVLGRRDGSLVGGDLGEAVVRPTLEVMMIESPTHLQRVHDPVSGLALSSRRRAASPDFSPNRAMIAPGSVVLAFHGAQPRLVVLASTEKCQTLPRPSEGARGW